MQIPFSDSDGKWIESAFLIWFQSLYCSAQEKESSIAERCEKAHGVRALQHYCTILMSAVSSKSATD